MKKYMIAAGVALLGLTSVNAQEISFGAKAGVNLANFSGDDAEDLKMKVGAFVGGYANIGLTEKLFVQPEVLFSMQGSRFDGEIDGGSDLNYINIPVMVQYGVTDNIRVELGPQVGILLSAEQGADDDKVDVKELTKSVDFGVNAGGTYYMDNGLNFTLRYSMGLTNIGDADGLSEVIDGITIEVEEADTKNAVISVGVGYSF